MQIMLRSSYQKRSGKSKLVPSIRWKRFHITPADESNISKAVRKNHSIFSYWVVLKWKKCLWSQKKLCDKTRCRVLDLKWYKIKFLKRDIFTMMQKILIHFIFSWLCVCRTLYCVNSPETGDVFFLFLFLVDLCLFALEILKLFI